MTEAFFLNATGLFLIALVRFSGFFLNTPVYSQSIIPTRIKAGLSALCAMLILPHLIRTQTLPSLSVMEYGIMVIKELVLGFLMGYMVVLIMDILRFAGQIVGMQVGFSFVQVADPGSSQGLGIVAEFFQLSGTLMFLVIGGHLVVLRAFFISFDMIPVAGFQYNPGMVEEIILYSRMLFLVGLQIAMPIVAIVLMGDVGLGIIARTVPKMNIFQVGFSLKILGGLSILVILVPYLGEIIKILIELSIDKINLVLVKMG